MSQRQVRQFMREMGQETPLAPTYPGQEIAELRVRLIQEELDELASHTQGERETVNLTAVADDLADLLYVVYGAAVAYGITIEPVFNLVHAANMRKVGGPVRQDGKRLKPPGWVGPEDDITRELIEQYMVVEGEFEAV